MPAAVVNEAAPNQVHRNGVSERFSLPSRVNLYNPSRSRLCAPWHSRCDDRKLDGVTARNRHL